MSADEITNEVNVFFDKLASWAAVALPSFIGALVILLVGWWLANRAEVAMDHVLARQSRIDATLCSVISKVVRYAILIVVVVAVLGQLGIQTTSILAALGAAGLAIGLAMQGTLSNIAAGMMLLWLRPFQIGDYIDTGSVAGTVKDIGLFATEASGTVGELEIAMIVFVAVWVAFIVAGLVGSGIPILLRKLGQDPALASNIFLTMITDLVSFSGFLLTATLLLP